MSPKYDETDGLYTARIPNAVHTPPGPANGFQVYNNGGRVDVIIDVVGSFALPT
jgi:hypothetical protein